MMSANNNSVKLKSLCGVHTLQGVEQLTLNLNDYGGENVLANAIKFKLDEITYIAIENCEDDFRSCCEELLICNDKPPKYHIPNCKVNCTMMPDDKVWKEVNDVLVLTDVFTDSVVLEIGTINVGEYYPCFHYRYYPQNMWCNWTDLNKFAKVTHDLGGEWWQLENSENYSLHMCKSKFESNSNYYYATPTYQVFDSKGKRKFVTTNIEQAYEKYNNYVANCQ